MTNTTLIVIVVLVAIAVVIGVWMFGTARRRAQLKAQFGPEYDRTVRDAPSVRQAEARLDARAARVSRYRIRALTPDERADFTRQWTALQRRFVDEPAAAVAEADRLVTDLMTRRGYPMGDFDARADDLSVGHADVVHHYREAHAIAVRHARQGVSTEDLRQGVIHYRALFDELLDVVEPARRRA
jgi:hypothetical protein